MNSTPPPTTFPLRAAAAGREHVRALRRTLQDALGLPVFPDPDDALAAATLSLALALEVGHARLRGDALVPALGPLDEQITYDVTLDVRLAVVGRGVLGASGAEGAGEEPLADEVAAATLALAAFLATPVDVVSGPGAVATLTAGVPGGRAGLVRGDDGVSAYRIEYAASLAFTLSTAAPDVPPSDPSGPSPDWL